MRIVSRIAGTLAVISTLALAACGSSPEKSSVAAANPSAAKPSGPPPPADVAAADTGKPPTDDQVKKDVAGAAGGIISIAPSSEAGKKSWNTANKQYFWEKWVDIVRDANLAGSPGVKLKVGGYARYEITGGVYSYREFKVATNEYEGIPRPDDKEAVAFVKAHRAEIFVQRADKVVNADKMEISVAQGDAQNWEWHEPKSVSFNVNVKYEYVKSPTEIATEEAIWRVRIYRDEPKGPWLRTILGSEEKVIKTDSKTYTPAEVSAMRTGFGS